jgi:DNA-binding response OmpR family regulator
MWTTPCNGDPVGGAGERGATAATGRALAAPSPVLPPLNRRVLVVESDAGAARSITAQLRRLGCTSRVFDDGSAALAALPERAVDLVLIAVRLAGSDGLELHRRWRAQDCRTPIVMLAADADELRAVLELDPMADDVLVRPFGMLDLAARLASVLRRACPALPPRLPFAPVVIETAGLRVDRTRREVHVLGAAVELTAREFDLLAHLAANPGRVFKRAELLDQVWGHAPCVYEHTVSSHVNRLRAKIERDPARPEFVQTAWGVGYRFAERSS